MTTVEQISLRVVAGNSVRPHFDRTADEYSQQILEEAQELVDEIQEALITGCPFNVVGEIADILILITQLCSDLGIDPAQAMEYKNIRNDLKYPTTIMSNGYTPEEAKRVSKEAWQALGGDEKFAEIYSTILADETE